MHSASACYQWQVPSSSSITSSSTAGFDQTEQEHRVTVYQDLIIRYICMCIDVVARHKLQEQLSTRDKTRGETACDAVLAVRQSCAEQTSPILREGRERVYFYNI
jgi:hypothetical protein